MNEAAKQYCQLRSSIESHYSSAKIIAVSKTQSIDAIEPILQAGCRHFGENVLQESLQKWPKLKAQFPDVSLHFLGRLQSNKVKQVVELFDYVHSVDREKIANKISECQQEVDRKISLFIQVNLARESQKGGLFPEELVDFYQYCQQDQSLDIVGLMTVPPNHQDCEVYFKELARLAKQLNLSQLSMGMSNDYLQALACGATFVRVGQTIFGRRA